MHIAGGRTSIKALAEMSLSIIQFLFSGAGQLVCFAIAGAPISVYDNYLFKGFHFQMIVKSSLQKMI